MTGERYEPEIQGVSIVAVGSLNPAIFQPLWFAGNNLIREEEAKSADIQIIHKDVTVFSTEWFSMQVTQDRFAADTNDPTKYQPLRDLVVGTFKVLEHTPIHAFGLNTNRHFRLESEDAWHAFGHYYAPKDTWRHILTNPGLRSLMIEGKRESCGAQRIRVKVEPSTKVHPGVFVHVNEHYTVEEEKNSNPTDRIVIFLRVLQESWDGFLTYSREVAFHLLDEANKQSE